MKFSLTVLVILPRPIIMTGAMGEERDEFKRRIMACNTESELRAAMRAFGNEPNQRDETLIKCFILLKEIRTLLKSAIVITRKYQPKN